MSKILRILSLVLVLFTAVTALWGGGLLILDPTGNTMHMPLVFLEKSPFENYFIPGIILFTLNGVLNLVTALMIIKKMRFFPVMIFIQGIILSGWIIGQIILLQIFYPQLHLPYLITGIVLIIFSFRFVFFNPIHFQNHINHIP